MKNEVYRAKKAKTTDKDLQFLSSCESEDLRVLCDILTHDHLGNIRITEQLTSTDEYNRNYPEDMLFLVPQISNELLKYGSNTLTTFWNKEPDSYATVLRRVCKQMDVRVSDHDTVTKMEHNLLTTLCRDTLEPHERVFGGSLCSGSSRRTSLPVRFSQTHKRPV